MCESPNQANAIVDLPDITNKIRVADVWEKHLHWPKQDNVEKKKSARNTPKSPYVVTSKKMEDVLRYINTRKTEG